MTPPHAWTAAIVLAGAIAGCTPQPASSARTASAIVYGTDDRQEFFEVTATAERARIARSLVALVPKASLVRTAAGVIADRPTWGERDGLCPGERFSEQPAAAFCTGVLVDWDLVLTA